MKQVIIATWNKGLNYEAKAFNLDNENKQNKFIDKMMWRHCLEGIKIRFENATEVVV